MIKATALSHKFDYPLFEDINIHIKNNEKIAIIGVSGSGKSTLLHILSTFLKPNSGSIKIFDKNMYHLSDKELNFVRKKYIGLIFQQHYLFRGFTALENIKISSILTKHSIDFDLIKKLKIDNIINQPISELSGGQQQRVSIARVLTKKPRLLFADEPTGNLDKTTANEVIKLLTEYTTNINGALFLVTHDDRIANLCDKKYLLEDKQLKLL